MIQHPNEQYVSNPHRRHGRYWLGLHQLAHVLDGEWVPAILATLIHGPRHFTEILSAVHATGVGQPDARRRLHDSILGRTLRRMEDNGLITRHEIEATFPRSTTYEMTPWSIDLLTALMPAVQWTNSRETGDDDEGGQPPCARPCPPLRPLQAAV